MMKMTVFLYWVTDDFKDEGGRYALAPEGGMNGYTCTHSGSVWTLVGQREVDFEVAAFDPRDLSLKALKTKKSQIIAEATQKAEQIEEKIQQLLALPASVAA